MGRSSSQEPIECSNHNILPKTEHEMLMCQEKALKKLGQLSAQQSYMSRSINQRNSEKFNISNNKMIELSSAGGSLILPISINKVKSVKSGKSGKSGKLTPSKNSKTKLEDKDNQLGCEPA